MKIFVVGGRAISERCSGLLLNEAHEVGIFDNLSEGHRDAVEFPKHFIEGELADRQQIQAALSTHRPDAVMAFRRQRAWLASRCRTVQIFSNNICNGLNLLDAMSRLVCGGSSFRRHAPFFGPPIACQSTKPPSRVPSVPTANPKLALKNSALVRRDSWSEFVCLRYFNASGASEKFAKTIDRKRISSGCAASGAR